MLSNHYYIILLLCLLLLAFTIWLEYKRPNKKRLALSLLASIISIISLYFLIVPLTYQTTIKKNTEAILLTDEYNKDSLSFFQQTNKNLPVFNIHNFPFTKAFSVIHVFGSGLANNELNQLNNQHIIFHPSTIKGITNIQWQQTIASNEKLIVQGFYNNRDKETKIVLRGLGANIDSVFIKPNQQQSFQLKAMPKHIGKAVYELITIHKADTIEKNNFPVEVIKQQPFKVLFLAASPDFENRFLSHWLFENNYSNVIRSRISKDKFSNEFANNKSINTSVISAELLKQFQIIIADEQELKNISSNELITIQNAVQKGVGILVKADTASSKKLFYSSFFPLHASNKNAAQLVELSLLTDDEKIKLLIDQPIYITSQINTQTLLRDDQQNIFASSCIQGLGKIVFTTLSKTYNLQLRGNNEQYALLWKTLLEKTLSANENKSIAPTQFLTYQNQQIILHSNNNQSININSINSSFIQNNKLFNQSTINCWPSNAGWQTITSGNDSSSFYVFNKSEWKNVQAAEKITATNNYINHQQKNIATNNNKEEKQTETVPPFYFFILFLASCIYLWIERKL